MALAIASAAAAPLWSVDASIIAAECLRVGAAVATRSCRNHAEMACQGKLAVAAPQDPHDTVSRRGAVIVGRLRAFDRGEGFDAISAAALGMIERGVGKLNEAGLTVGGDGSERGVSNGHRDAIPGVSDMVDA